MEIPQFALSTLFGLLTLLLAIVTGVLNRKLKAARTEVLEVEERIQAAGNFSRELYLITEHKADAIFSGFLVNSFLRLEKTEKENKVSALFVAHAVGFVSFVLREIVWLICGIVLVVSLVLA